MSDESRERWLAAQESRLRHAIADIETGLSSLRSQLRLIQEEREALFQEEDSTTETSVSGGSGHRLGQRDFNEHNVHVHVGQDPRANSKRKKK